MMRLVASALALAVLLAGFACAFDVQPVEAVPTATAPHSDELCGVLSAAGVARHSPEESLALPASVEAVGTGPEPAPRSSLPDSIDHPPRFFA